MTSVSNRTRGAEANRPAPVAPEPAVAHNTTGSQGVTPAPQGLERSIVTLIEPTDAAVMRYTTVPRGASVVRILSDDDLLRVLADAGKPAGLAYARDGSVSVLYR
ncbi:MAG: hypothetical protein QM770_00675 [Tepidisphaeraceae bacterium]